MCHKNEPDSSATTLKVQKADGSKKKRLSRKNSAHSSSSSNSKNVQKKGKKAAKSKKSSKQSKLAVRDQIEYTQEKDTDSIIEDTKAASEGSSSRSSSVSSSRSSSRSNSDLDFGFNPVSKIVSKQEDD